MTYSQVVLDSLQAADRMLRAAVDNPEERAADRLFNAALELRDASIDVAKSVQWCAQTRAEFETLLARFERVLRAGM